MSAGHEIGQDVGRIEGLFAEYAVEVIQFNHSFKQEFITISKLIL